MFLSEVSLLQRLSSRPQTTTLGTVKSGTQINDSEIERMYNRSPVISDWPTSFQNDEEALYTVENEASAKSGKDSTISRNRWKEIFGMQSIPSGRFDIAPIPAAAPPSASSSALTQALEHCNVTSKNGKAGAGKLKFTVYLPDYNNFTVFAWDSSTVGEFLRLIMEEHQDQDIDPPLAYNNISLYELRMVDDGEPDRDFPALTLNRQLGQLNIDEVFLCEVEGGGGASSSKRAKSIAPGASMFPASQFGSIPTGRYSSIGGKSHAPPPPMSFAPGNGETRGSGRESSASPTLPMIYSRGRDDSGIDYSSSFYERSDAGDDEEDKVSIATIIFPSGLDIKVPYETGMTLKDILVIASVSNKLRPHTDEYYFTISATDQKKLKLMSSTIDMNVAVDTIGTQTFEIHKRIYADSAKITKVAPPIVAAARNVKASVDNDMTFVFTEATANAYKEWNVVKRNIFGRRQERIFGVDGRMIYNGKRGQLKGDRNGVQRAHREISSIIKIDIFPNDPKSFRIQWMGEKDMYNLEYTFESARDCAEVYAKIKFIRNNLMRGNNKDHRGSNP